jgi:hypothetical protein
MKTLTLITEGNRINHHYEIKSAGLAPSSTGASTDYRIMVIMDDDEADNFLMDFVNGNTGYRLQIDTDEVRIEIKRKCFVTAKVYADENTLAFIISAEKIVS